MMQCHLLTRLVKAGQVVVIYLYQQTIKGMDTLSGERTLPKLVSFQKTTDIGHSCAVTERQ